MKKALGIVAAIFILAFVIVTLVSALPAVKEPLQQASEPAPFDHSNCQYPERYSNPVDGCDNSDPAVPECIKAMESRAAEAACISELNNVNPAPEYEAAEFGGK